MNSADLSSSSSSLSVETTSTATPRSSALSGGASIEVAILDKLSLTVDLLYRSAGYNTGNELIEGVDDPDTEEDDRSTTRTFQRTRAVYWDVPVMLRLYDAGWRERRPTVFFNIGGAARRVSKIRTFREFELPDGTHSIDESPVEPANRLITGIVAGGGFQFRSASGLKVTPEVRLTRWLSTTFDSSPALSRRNQVEFLLGLTF
jgi:hypothetical protein